MLRNDVDDGLENENKNINARSNSKHTLLQFLFPSVHHSEVETVNMLSLPFVSKIHVHTGINPFHLCKYE